MIPALNEESCVARVLKHLSTLDPPPAEIIVSVGDSADATAAIATEHGAKVVAGARGRSKQMNDGAAAASGDVVLFLHADTTVAERRGDGSRARRSRTTRASSPAGSSRC